MSEAARYFKMAADQGNVEAIEHGKCLVTEGRTLPMLFRRRGIVYIGKREELR